MTIMKAVYGGKHQETSGLRSITVSKPRRKADRRKTLFFIPVFIMIVGLILMGSPPRKAFANSIVVNTNADNSTAGDKLCTLREAINNANLHSDTTGGDCTAGSGTDTITFDGTVFSTAKTITLTGALPSITGTLTIDGPGANLLTVDGAGSFRPFYVTSGADLTLDNLTISNGSSGTGGGIYNNGGTLTVTNVTLLGNSAAAPAGTVAQGGGIYNGGGTVTVTNTTLSGNTVTAAGGIPGAVYSGGGGICNNGGTLKVINTTLSGNSASTSSPVFPVYGGGIYNDGGTMTVTNTTLSGNSADNSGGGIYNNDTLNLNNSIVANSTGGDCVNSGSGTTNAQNSLIEDGLNCVNGTGSNNLMVNPMLGTLADNGGPTETMALQAGSQAIDAGDNSLAVDAGSTQLTTDQRGAGYARIIDGKVDMGAYEFSEAPNITSADNTTFTFGSNGSFTVTTTGFPTPALSETGNLPVGVTLTDNSDGTATLSGTPASGTAGTYNITLKATNKVLPDATQSFTLTVDKASTTTAVTSGANPSVYGQPVTLTATVTPGATGTVTFAEGATTYCSSVGISVNQAKCVISSLSGGTHTITATYGGNANYNGSSGTVSQTVYPTTVTVAATTRNGNITLSTAGTGCWFSSYSAVPADDPGFVHPYGLVDFTLTCSQPDAQAYVTITYPGSIEKDVYRKYGPTIPGDLSTTKWYTFKDVKIDSATSVTLHLQDGQLGDDTPGGDGIIKDQGGEGNQLPAPVPAITEWGMVLFMLFAGLMGIYIIRRRRA